MMLRAVLFDLDGTLLPLDFDAFLPRYLDRFFQFIGRERRGAMMAAAAAMMGNDGRATNADVFWAAAGLDMARATFEARYADFVADAADLLGAGITPDPGARAAVEACRARGLRVALATNPIFPRAMIAARARWAGLSLDDFDLVTCADTMRFCKPRPEYFQEVAALLGVPAEACLMVGNDVALDLAPAHRAGMATCLVVGPYAVPGAFTPDHSSRLAGVPAVVGLQHGLGGDHGRGQGDAHGWAAQVLPRR